MKSMWWKCKRWQLSPQYLRVSSYLRASSVSNHKWIGKTANISPDWASLILPSEHEKKRKPLCKQHEAWVCGLSNLTLRCWIILMCVIWCDPWCLSWGPKTTHKPIWQYQVGDLERKKSKVKLLLTYIENSIVYV